MMNNQKVGTILFADIEGCSTVSDILNISDYNNFIESFHKAAIKTRKMCFSKFDGWDSSKIEFTTRGDEACVILHSGDETNDVKLAFSFAIYLKLLWLLGKDNQERIKAGKSPRELGIGIHQGLVFYDYHCVDERKGGGFRKVETSEGYAINLTKRIESASRNGKYSKIFVSEKVKYIAKKTIFFIEFDEGKKYEMKGISNPPYLYETKIIDEETIIEFIPELPKIDPNILDKYIELANENEHEFWSNLVKYSLELERLKKQGTLTLIPTKGQTVKDLYEYGTKASFLEKYDVAIEFFKKIIEKEPNYFEIWIKLGIVYCKMDQYDDAIKCFEKAREKKPKRPESYFNLALAYYAKENNEKALENYKKVTKIMPGEYESWYNMAKIYSQQGKKEECKTALETAIALNPYYRKKWET